MNLSSNIVRGLKTAKQQADRKKHQEENTRNELIKSAKIQIEKLKKALKEFDDTGLKHPEVERLRQAIIYFEKQISKTENK